MEISVQLVDFSVLVEKIYEVNFLSATVSALLVSSDKLRVIRGEESKIQIKKPLKIIFWLFKAENLTPVKVLKSQSDNLYMQGQMAPDESVHCSSKHKTWEHISHHDIKNLEVTSESYVSSSVYLLNKIFIAVHW